MTKHVRRIMWPSQVALPYEKYIFIYIRETVWFKYETWASYSHVSTLRLWNALQKDYETTSPRIHVNRRTPPCLLLNFPDSSVQDRSASLRYFQ